MIFELTSFSDTQLADLDVLIHQLSPSSNCTAERLQEVMNSPDSHLYVAVEPDGSLGSSSDVEGHIVGCATLCVMRTPEMTIGSVEAVAVLESCRGRGLGRSLMQYLLDDARRLGVSSLHLTSNPRRTAANALYQSLGFERYDTNCYHLAQK